MAAGRDPEAKSKPNLRTFFFVFFFFLPSDYSYTMRNSHVESGVECLVLQRAACFADATDVAVFESPASLDKRDEKLLPIRPIISTRTCSIIPCVCRLVFLMQTRFSETFQGRDTWLSEKPLFLPFRKVPFFIASSLYALSLTDGGLV
jgi:hypothetical protein